MEECKRCLLRESSQEDIYETIRERIEKLKEGEKAQAELYAQRLDLCRKCEHLISGVCMKCGCYVELRAAFKNQHCPLPFANKKW